MEQVFPCDKWLAVDEGEGQIEYTLYEQLSMRKQMDKSMTPSTFLTSAYITHHIYHI